MPTPESSPNLALVIRDLLTIARVAMPANLHSIDPRVIRATALMKRLATGSSSRVPDTPGRVRTGMEALLEDAVFVGVDPDDPATGETIRAMNALRGPVEVDLDLDVRQALEQFTAETGRVEFTAETIRTILREWRTTNGYLPLDPPKEGGH